MGIPAKWLDVFRKRGLVAEERTIAVGHAFLNHDRTLETSEKRFQAAVIDFAESLGWKVYHTYDSRRSKAGFPDLCMVRFTVVFAELKVPGGKLSADQRDWIETLRLAGAAAYVWFPSQWPEIEKVLRES